MSLKYPIIAITGSSGAGTTSVKRTFEQIFRREKVEPVYIEGDAFHRWNRVEMREQMKQAGEKGDHHYSHFGADANLLEELEKTFAEYAATGGGRTRHLYPRRRRGRHPRLSAGHVHALARIRAGIGPAVLRRPARLRRHRQGEPRPACRHEDRRRPRHQSRMDPKAVSRSIGARLFDRGGDRHDPSAHARLSQLHLSAIFGDRHQFPARADRRHFQSVHRAMDPDAGRIRWWSSGSAIRAASTSPICSP